MNIAQFEGSFAGWSKFNADLLVWINFDERTGRIGKSMENEKKIKIKPGFVLRKIAGSDVVIPIGNNIADFKGLITLNETAAFLFKLISEGSSSAELIDALIKEYDVDRELARNDIDSFLSQLKKADMLMNA